MLISSDPLPINFYWTQKQVFIREIILNPLKKNTSPKQTLFTDHAVSRPGGLLFPLFLSTFRLAFHFPSVIVPK